MICPKCNQECNREEVDIGVGTQYSPWFCINPDCGWNEQDEVNKYFDFDKNKYD